MNDPSFTGSNFVEKPIFADKTPNDGLGVLALVPEAYGGFGGVAVYNIDLVDAVCALPYVSSVTLLPRIIRTAPTNLPAKVNLQAKASNSLVTFGREVARFANQSFDLILCTHMHLLPFAQMVSVISRAPVACVLYGTEAWVPTRRFMVDHLVRRCSTLISISEYTASRFRAWSGVPADLIALLPNAIHADRFGVGEKPTFLVERYGIEEARVIMTLGRLDARERQKGFDELIDLMPRLVVTVPDLRYLIAGDGDDQPRLQAKVDSLGLTGKVIFTGRVSEEEKADHYRLADVFSMVGRQEGFGFVFLEALACGTPVVASTLDGSQDAVLQGALGELANPDDPESIYEAIMRALAKPHAIPPRLDHFSFANFVSRLDRILGRYSSGQFVGECKYGAVA